MNNFTSETIRNNQKYFNWYLILPTVTTVFFGIVNFILGIVFTAIGENAIYLLYFWVFGAVFCFLHYIVFKIILSYSILHIYYLRKIAEGQNDQNNESAAEDEPDILPEI